MRILSRGLRTGLLAAMAISAISMGLVGAAAVEPAASGDWLAQVRERIQVAEYHVTWQEKTLTPGGAAWHAANRAQDLRMYFRPDGVEAIRRTGEGAGWVWRFQLKEWGRDGALEAVGAPEFHVSELRVDLRRGDLVERYENRVSGIEQVFVLNRRPAGSGALVLTARMGGHLRGRQVTGGAVAFDSGGETVVTYDRLKVIDAAGRERAASMQFSDGRLRLEVDDSGAMYPLVIDPTLTGPGARGSRGTGVGQSPAWSVEGTYEDEHLGQAIGTAGDVNGDGYSDVFVTSEMHDGGLYCQGRVDVFYGSASGLSSSPDWTVLGDVGWLYLGLSAATAGDVNGDGYADLVVGGYYGEDAEEAEGRAYVFYGSASGLSATADWTCESNQYYAEMGSWVSTAGDVNGDGYSDVLVCARYYTNTLSEEGAAFIWFGSADGLGDPGTPANADWVVYGADDTGHLELVACAGDVNGDGYSDVMASSPNFDSYDSDEGRVWVYYGSASGPSTTADWTATTTDRAAGMGDSIGTVGDFNGDGYADIFAGAHSFANPLGGQGSVFVWFGSASGLGTDGTSENADFALHSPYVTGAVGEFASPAGDVNGDGYGDLLVSAYRYYGGLSQEGKTFIWLGEASPPSWGSIDVAPWSYEGNVEQIYSGWGVANAGDVNGDGLSDVLVREPYYDGVTTETGRVLLFYGGVDGLSTSSQWMAHSPQSGAQLGISVDGAGDVNGDGYADVIVGAPGYDNGQDNEGQAYLYLGTASGLGLTPLWTGESNQIGAWYGVAVSGAGDVNADGYADIAVGAWYYDGAELNEGAVFVYHGSASGPVPNGTPANANWTGLGGQHGAFFGTSVDGLGDVNGDGYGDLIVGAPYHDHDGATTDSGRVHVFHGSSTGLGATAAWSQDSIDPYSHMGWCVRSAGDINGDGYSDAAFGAPDADMGAVENSGGAFVFPGSASGLNSSALGNWGAYGDAAGRRLGASIDGLGDLNGDGYGDVAVGAPSDTGATYTYVWYGSSTGMGSTGSPANADQTVAGPAGSGFGYSVAGVGDLNGDGYADMASGAPLYDNGSAVVGMVYVRFGGPVGIGLAGKPQWIYGSDDGGRFGVSVAGAGDVNGDAFSDLLVGAHYYSDPATNEGAAYLYCGGGRLGRDMRLRQRQVSAGTMVQPLCATVGRFRASFLGHTPFGRGKLRAAVECKPFGTAFDGADLQTMDFWQDTGTISTEFERIVHGADAGMYRWRMRLIANSVTTPFGHPSRWYALPESGWSDAMLRMGAAQSHFLNTQGIAITADGQYWAGAYNYGHGVWENTIDVSADATMQYQALAGKWVGIYVYDYTTAVWTRGAYVYKESLN